MKILKLKILDKLVIVSLIILTLLPAAIVMLTNTTDENRVIIITVNSKVEKTISFTNLSEGRTYEFNFNNITGYVEVKNGKIRMLEMDKKICPDVICSETGWIDKAYQSIVCLPNKIIVTIEGKKYEGIDAQSY
jgi:hypothetical protein